MKIEIDQSGRVEYTSKPTVVGFSNGKEKTVIILSTEKQKLQRFFRRLNKPRMFTCTLFSFLIYFLLKNERNIEQVIIDKEYPGQDALIKSLILNFFKRGGRRVDKRVFIFKQIGKKARIHGIVNDAYRVKRADIKLTANEVIRILKSGVL